MLARVTFRVLPAPPLRAGQGPWAGILALAGVLSALSNSAIALDRPAGPGKADVPLYAPNELLVKFKPDASAELQLQLHEGRTAGAIRLTDSLDLLSAKHRVKRVAPVFRDFQQNHQRLRALESRNWLTLSETERRLVRRRRRAPADAPVPALDRFYKLELEPGVSVEAAVADYNHDPSVEYAEPNYIATVDFTPTDPYFDKQWALHNVGQAYPIPGGGTATGTPDSDINAPEAWDVCTATDPVVVAIVDSGVDYNHPDLASQMWIDRLGFYGYDFKNNDFDPMDDRGHGTHCAGIVAAGFNNGIGISGVCPNARIMALKFTGDDGRGLATNAAAAITHAVHMGADIVSNSYGFDSLSETLESAVEYAHSEGLILVASAGNEWCAKPHYPASFQQVIAVAATDSDDVKADSSSYGNWVDISAPGSNILSLRAAGTDMVGDGEHIVDNDYYIASGTSMACPHVAGVAAMILSHFPDLPSEEITARLLGTTEVIATQNPAYAHLIGSGALNASNALTHEEHPAIIFGDYAILDDSLGNGNQFLDPGETASLSVLLKNLWADATDVDATLLSADPNVTVTRSTVDYGDIASGQTHENTAEPFEVQLSSAAPPDTPVEFSLNINTGEGYTRLLGFVATNEIRLQRGDWPKGWYRYEQPIPYDIDGDGFVELILKRSGIARIYKPDGSLRVELGDGLDIVATVLLGDLQRDGHVEIIAVRIDRYTNRPYLSVWDKDGDEVCPAFHPDPSLSTARMVLSDLDGDDDLEIILGGPSGNGFAIQSIDWVGSMLETQWVAYPETPDWPYSYSRIAVGDIDAGLHGSRDSADVTSPSGPELLFAVCADGSEVGQLYALHSDGQVVQGWPVPAVYATVGPLLADLTGDGNLEVIFYGPPNALGEGLYVWDHAGNLLWTAASGGGTPVIADLDGDGDVEVLTQTTAVHHDGTPTGWYYNVRVAEGASVGDIDGDGDMEVLISGAGGDGLRGFHYDGTPIDGFPLFIDPQHKHTSMTPVLADLDRDGDIEVTITGAYFAVWDLYGQYDRANVEWGMYRYDPYRTNCYNPDFNLPPVWYTAPEDRIVVRTEMTDFYIQATDPEGEPAITYEVLDAPAGAHYEPEGNGLRFSWQPGINDTSQDITFCATDEDGERIAKTIRIAVVDALVDMDGDGDMDLMDYQRFWGCCRGPAEPLASPICGHADADNDNDVDLKDFAELQIGLGALAK